uniref:Stimulator of interferon genes protein n=1 Tax=Scophthalmus maximus TaxID=52904 RepID=A0A8D3AMQ7_SCOMX
MQCHRDQEEFVLRLRGSLPKVCAAVLVVMTVGGVKFVSPERLFGWVAMVILILTLGPLLHGLCLLAEEMLYHSNTRYRGQGLLSHMLPACGLGGQTLLAAVLAGLLLYLAGNPLLDEGQCWKLVFLVSALYALFKSLGVLGPSEVEVSDICETRKMNVAHGLAWSFYLGYLRLVLPRLEDSIRSFHADHKASSPRWGRGSRKLLILIPLDSKVSHKIEDEDDNIHFYDNLPNNEIDRAGVRGRVYKHSVYRVRGEHGKAHLCVVEYATPLLTLYNMSHESSAGFGEPERRQQVLLFYRTLRDILENSLQCRNRYKLILLNGQRAAKCVCVCVCLCRMSRTLWYGTDRLSGFVFPRTALVVNLWSEKRLKMVKNITGFTNVYNDLCIYRGTHKCQMFKSTHKSTHK